MYWVLLHVTLLIAGVTSKYTDSLSFKVQGSHENCEKKVIKNENKWGGGEMFKPLLTSVTRLKTTIKKTTKKYLKM